MLMHPATQGMEPWPIDKLVFYARNPRKNDSAALTGPTPSRSFLA